MAPSSLQTWQATTAVAATSIASLNLSLSFLVTPIVLDLPTPLMLRQWTSSYRRTKSVFPLTMVACGLSYAGLAFRLSSSAATATRSRLLAAAAALCFSVVPFTRIFMLKRLNTKILQLADRYGGQDVALTAQQEESAKWLVDQWGLWNLGRGVPVAIAGIIGVFVLLD